MQQNIRKELNNLCLDILKQDESNELKGVIDDCQTLLQKLLVADYLLNKNEIVDKITRESRPTEEAVNEIKSEQNREGESEKTGASKVQNRESNSQAEQPKVATQAPTPVQKQPITTENKVETPAQQENKNLNQSIETEHPVKETSPLQAVADEIEEATPALGLDDFKANTTVPPANQDNLGSINARFAKGRLAFGLNDRIAFVKNLFGGNMDDFNRVISQLNTFEDFEEAENFVENMVKPDYDWRQKEEYEMRFKNSVRQRFGLDDLEE